MKKGFFLIAAFFALTTTLSAIEFTAQLHPSGHDIIPQMNGNIALFPRETWFGYDGEPALPMYSLTFIIPDGASVESVVIEDPLYVTALHVEIPKQIADPLFPNYRAGASIEEGKNMDIYGTNAFYPANHIGTISEGNKRGVHLIRIPVYPFLYNPVTKELRHLVSGTLKVISSGNSNTVVYPIRSKFDVSFFQSLLFGAANASAIHSIQPYLLPELRNRLYIITTDRIVNESKKGEWFVRSKNDRGFDVVVVTPTRRYFNNVLQTNQSGWGGGIGYLASERIRAWLKTERASVGQIDFLLLIGDPDPIYGDVPMKRTDLGEGNDDAYQSMIPTDFYYAELTSDWPIWPAKMTSWGARDTEVEIDNMGRIPVYLSDSDGIKRLDSILSKIVAYENRVDQAELDRRRNIFLLQGDMGWLQHQNFDFDNPNSLLPLNGALETKGHLKRFGYHDFDSRSYQEPWVYHFMSDQTWDSKGYAEDEYGNPGLSLEEATALCITRDDWGLACSELKEEEDEEGNTYYNCTCIWNDWLWNDDTRRDELFSFDDRDIEKDWAPFLWNTYGPGIVFFNAHGGPTGASPVFDNRDAFTVDREKQAVIIQASCLTGWPDSCSGKYCHNDGSKDKMSLANAMLLNGAIISIAPTRVAGGIDMAGYSFIISHFWSHGEYWGASFSNYFIGHLAEKGNHTTMVMSTFYGDPTIKMSGYEYESGDTRDSDGDGVRDRFDTCPDRRNPVPMDSDGDGIDDACDPCPFDANHADYDGDGTLDCADPCPGAFYYSSWYDVNGNRLVDSDGDGIPDVCDNCPLIKNPYQAAPDWNSELIQGECRLGGGNSTGGNLPYCGDARDGGARYQTWNHNLGYVRWEGSLLIKKGTWYWQPDHDLDGIGDVCDNKGTTFVDRFGDTITADGTYYTKIATRAVNIPSGSRYVAGGRWDYREVPSEISIEHDSGIQLLRFGAAAHPTTLRYCWVPQSRYDEYWGKDGYCTTSNRTYRYSRYSSDFAYSHGSDPAPIDPTSGKNAWQQPTGTNKIESSWESWKRNSTKQIFTWDWKNDYKADYPNDYETYVNNAAKNPGLPIAPCISYAISGGPTGVVACTEENDLIDDGQGGKTQNPACFRNSAIFARSTRDSYQGTPITYGKYVGVFDPDDKFLPPVRLPFDVAHTIPEARPGYPFQDDRFEQWAYDAATKAITKSQRIIPQENLKVALNYDGETLFFYEDARTGTVEIKTQTIARPSDMALAGSFALPHGVGPLTSGAILDDQLYLVIGGGLYHITAIDDPQPGEHTHAVTRIGTIPNTGTARHLIAAAHRLYLLTYESDALTLYSFNASAESFDLIETATKPAARDFINVSVGSDGTIYFIGGMTVAGETATPHHDLWSYTPYDGFTELASDLPVDLYTTFTVTEGDTIRFITQPQQQTYSAAAVVLDTATGTVTVEEIAIAERPGDTRDGYCIARNGNAVTGGIDLLWEGCHPFDEPAYKKYWFLDYKHSLVGKKDRLYVGGLTGIRVLKVEDDGSLTAENLTILGTVSDMVIWGDYLYAVTGTKIHVLRIGTDGALKKVRSVSTGGAVNLTRYGQFLIAAETKGAVFYNLFDDPTKPVKVFTIPTTYPALDVAVLGDRLAIYHDRFFATGRTALYDLTNIETPVKLGETKKECDLAQFGEDRGTLYLGCWSGIYEVGQDASFTALTGDRAILYDHYERNGMVYQVNNGHITVSR